MAGAGEEKLNIVSCILAVNRKKNMLYIFCALQGFPGDISVSARYQLSPGTSTLLSSCLCLRVSHLLSCTLQIQRRVTHFNYTGSQFSQRLTLHLSGCAIKSWSPHRVTGGAPGAGGALSATGRLYVASCIHFHMYVLCT